MEKLQSVDCSGRAGNTVRVRIDEEERRRETAHGGE
jgi:hypothetical protein